VRAVTVVGTTALLCVPMVLQAASLGSAAGASATCDNYNAQAASDGVRAGFAGDNVLPLTNATDAEGPAAFALVQSGASTGHAAAPYPGDAALSALGLVGNGVDSSLYPTSAQSQYPTRTHAAVSNVPGLSLTSDSTETRSKAVATAGGDATAGAGNDAGTSKSVATAECSPTVGITADADTDTEALSFSGGTLRIGRVHSQAHSLTGLDGKVVIKSDLQFGQVTVAGQTVKISDDGFSAAGQVIPLPNPAGDVLKGQGITLAYVAPVKDPDGRGITAPGLVVSVVLPLNQLGQGTSPSTVTYTFGRAYARTEGSLTAPSAGASSGSGGFGVGTSGSGGGTGSASAPGLSAPGPDTAPALGETGPAPAVAGGSGATAAGPATRGVAFGLPSTDWVSLYLALVLGGAALFGGGLVLRRLVERQQWI
jgi:hypothetical protein